MEYILHIIRLSFHSSGTIRPNEIRGHAYGIQSASAIHPIVNFDPVCHFQERMVSFENILVLTVSTFDVYILLLSGEIINYGTPQRVNCQTAAFDVASHRPPCGICNFSVLFNGKPPGAILIMNEPKHLKSLSLEGECPSLFHI